MNNFFYISILDRASYTDFILDKIENYTLANFFVESYFSEIFDQNWDEDPVIPCPILVTNDPRLYLKYRCVYNEIDFKTYCRQDSWSNEINLLPLKDQLIIRSRTIGGGTVDEIFTHYENIKKRLYNNAFRHEESELIYDNGISYERSNGTKWSTSQSMDRNNQLLESYNEKFPDNDDNDETQKIDYSYYDWWESLSSEWKRIFKKHISKGIINNIPTENALREILKIKKLDASSQYLKTLAPLKHLKELEILNLQNNKITSLEDLVENKKLIELDCSANQIQSIACLKNNVNLVKLVCERNELLNLEGINDLIKISKCA